jgi:hypothetical protein
MPEKESISSEMCDSIVNRSVGSSKSPNVRKTIQKFLEEAILEVHTKGMNKSVFLGTKERSTWLPNSSSDMFSHVNELESESKRVEMYKIWLSETFQFFQGMCNSRTRVQQSGVFGKDEAI